MTSYEARTAYGVTIPRAFRDKAAALAWAEQEGDRFPGCRVVAVTGARVWTIWRHEQEARAA